MRFSQFSQFFGWINSGALRGRARLAALVTAAALMATGGAAAGGYGKWWHGDDENRYEHRAERIVDRFEDELKLSDEQEERIVAIVAAALQKRAAARAERAADMRALWTQPELNASEVEAALRERQENRESDKAEMREARLALLADTLAKIHAELTPKQREMAAEEFAGRFDLLDGRQGKRGKRGRHGGHHDDD